MKNTLRKGFALLMVLILLVPLLGVPALAALSDDPYSDQQWNLEMIGAEQGWQSGLTGRGVRVAIIDSGVSAATGDIDPDRLLAGKNVADETQSTEDTEGHGTFIAGIIGATKDNGVGIAGIAPGVTIIPIKTTDGSTIHVGVNSAAFYAAIDEFHCDVINYSTGTTVPSEEYREMVRYADSKGVIVISSVGNKGDSTVQYPAAFDEVIGVGSIGRTMECSSFSQHNSSVFVTAPGEKITSLSLGSGTVRTGSGTSYSTPHVVGLAALLKEAHPEMTTADFKEILKASCLDLGDEGYDEYYGWGLIQIPEAIRAADEYFASHTPDEPDPSPEPTPEPTPDPGSSWIDFFNFNWLRDLFRSIIRSLFKGWSPNLTF